MDAQRPEGSCEREFVFVDEIPEIMFLSHETLRLMRLMYDEAEFWEVLEHMKDSDGWLIIPFKDVPVLEEIKSDTIKAYNFRLN